jgi:site-specific DNA-methyltransferase (adenine-specific)
MTKPYYQDEAVTIYHGDCREIVPTLGRFDLLATDPPYGIGFREYESHVDNAEGYEDFIRSVVYEAEQHINGWAVVFQSAKRCRLWATTFDRPWRLLAYPKTFVQILQCPGPIYATDYALFWPVGTPETKRGRGRDWVVSATSDTSTRPKGHPCPRPIQQMMHVIETFSNPGHAVLDCFGGSGTTGRAAKDLGRKAVLIELEEKYCEMAANRMAQAVLPFAQEPSKATEPAQLFTEAQQS